MNNSSDNRFQVFFETPAYTDLKNLLYNYRLRKRRVAERVSGDGRILEVGSGLSPMIGAGRNVTYSDLSFTAMSALRKMTGKGFHVVADAGRLPFKSGAFQYAVCSEVLEHIQDDVQCIRELNRVLDDHGRLVITFPHRKAYFTNDDRFVAHFRRYEAEEMMKKLADAGFKTKHIDKVLGPLEKITMMMVIGVIEAGQWIRSGRRRKSGARLVPPWLHRLFDISNRLYMALAWLDAKAVPRSLASVLLIFATKNRPAA